MATRLLLDALRPPRARRKPNPMHTQNTVHGRRDGRLYRYRRTVRFSTIRLFCGKFLPPANPPIGCPTKIMLGYLPQVFHRKTNQMPSKGSRCVDSDTNQNLKVKRRGGPRFDFLAQTKGPLLRSGPREIVANAAMIFQSRNRTSRLQRMQSDESVRDPTIAAFIIPLDIGSPPFVC
jgi:hypothetical protein